jgi:hypothetical protein
MASGECSLAYFGLIRALSTVGGGEMPKLFLCGLLSAALLTPGFAAKDDKDSKKHNDAFIPGQAGETRIAQEVRHQLVMLPYYGVFDDLAFSVQGGVVTLVGAVTRPTLKSDAQRVTEKVEGVTQVVNNIEVLPLSQLDDRIRIAEYRAIYGDPTLSTMSTGPDEPLLCVRTSTIQSGLHRWARVTR